MKEINLKNIAYLLLFILLALGISYIAVLMINHIIILIKSNPDELKNVNELSKTILWTMGGIFAFGIAFWRASIADKNYKNDSSRLDIQKQEIDNEKFKFNKQQLNERYAKAVELIGNNEIPVRIGAIYTLEQLAKEDNDYTNMIIDILTSYIKSELKSERLKESHSNWLKELESWQEQNSDLILEQKYEKCYKTRPYRFIPEDIKAALAVLSSKSFELIDLKDTNWEGFDFKATSIKEFKYLDLTNVCLDYTKFSTQKFESCKLTNVSLKATYFAVVEFKGVYRDKHNNYNSITADFSYAYIDFVHISTPISQCVFNNTLIRAGNIVEDKKNNLTNKASNLIFKNSSIGSFCFNRALETIYFENVGFYNTKLMFHEKPLRNIFISNCVMFSGNVFHKISNDSLPNNIEDIRNSDNNVIFLDRASYNTFSALPDFNYGYLPIGNVRKSIITSWPSGFRNIIDELDAKPKSYWGLLTAKKE